MQRVVLLLVVLVAAVVVAFSLFSRHNQQELEADLLVDLTRMQRRLDALARDGAHAPGHRRSAQALSTSWRLVLSAGVKWRPAFQIVRFLAPGCEPHPLHQQPFASSEMPPKRSAAHAFDGHTTTEWRPDQQTCEPGRCFIGAVFGSPVDVGCVAFQQRQHAGRFHATELTLQRLDGAEWVDVAVFADLPFDEPTNLVVEG